MRTAAVRDDDAERDVHADRQQQVHHPAARLHVRPRPHQLPADAGTQRTTVARTDRQRRLLRRRTHADLARPVHVPHAAQVSSARLQPFEVKQPRWLVVVAEGTSKDCQQSTATPDRTNESSSSSSSSSYSFIYAMSERVPYKRNVLEM